MSYRLYFDITTGLAADLVVPKGTLASIWFHVEFMERHCGLKRVPAYVPEGEESKGLWRWSLIALQLRHTARQDGYDVAFSYDGGYDWCSKCGPIHSDAFFRRCAVCPHREAGECELRNEHPAEFEDEEEGGVA